MTVGSNVRLIMMPLAILGTKINRGVILTQLNFISDPHSTREFGVLLPNGMYLPFYEHELKEIPNE